MGLTGTTSLDSDFKRMLMNIKANIQLVKKLNENRVLNLIKDKGPISRNELARQTKISKVAISEIVNRLDEAGYILELGKGKSTSKGGKRPILLKLNAEAGYVIGIEIKRRITNIALANIESTIKETTFIEYQPGVSIDVCLPKIIGQIERLLKKNKIKATQLKSIGIGIPGFVNYEKGRLYFADSLIGWTNLPLASRFSAHFKVPSILENDVNVISLGEKLLGAGKGKNNLICIWVGEGIGAGIIMDGHLIPGASGNAGEIGYLEIGHFISDKKLIRFLYSGQRYFGQILSNINLFKVLTQQLQPNAAAAENNFDEKKLIKFLAAGDNGNPIVCEIIDEYAYLLAIICLHLIITINPSLIILNGPVVENSKYIMKKIKKIVKQEMAEIPFKSSTIVLGELRSAAGVKGAITLALQTIFEPPVTNRKSVPDYSS